LCDEFLLKTLKAFRVLVNRSPVFLEDDLLGRGGTDHIREPSALGRPPMGLARIADIVPEQEGLETQVSGFEVTDGLFTRSAQLAEGFIFDLGDVHRREITGAHQPGQLHGIASVRFHAVTGLFRKERGRHHPAIIACFAQLAIAPVTARPRFVDKDQLCGLGLHVSDELINVTLAGAHRAQGDNLGGVVFGHRGEGD
jgi:hypothetical protein